MRARDNTDWMCSRTDDLVTNFLGLGALLGGVIAAAVGGLVAHEEGADTDQLVVVVVTSVLMGLAIIGVVTSSVISCVTSFWVCFALDPTVLFNTKPRVYGRMMDALASRWGNVTEV